MTVMGTGTATSKQMASAAQSEASNSLVVREIAGLSSDGLTYPQVLETLKPPRFVDKTGTPSVLSSVRKTITAKWFWYAMASSLCWTGWAFTARIGSNEITPATMEFISAFGFVLVCLAVLGRKADRKKSSPAGKCYALVSGVLLALGGICLYGSYRSGYSVSVVTGLTSLYPIVTVLGAVMFLREKLNWLQVTGLFFAAVAMFILSL
jgi:bacterial/archaeal transporter family protein